jgi:DNA-directed RNA polymerase subunit RPC12/RpoP
LSKKKLKIIDRPMLGQALPAPPPIEITDGGTTFVCARCDADLLVAGRALPMLLIRCRRCGTISTTRGV